MYKKILLYLLIILTISLLLTGLATAQDERPDHADRELGELDVEFESQNRGSGILQVTATVEGELEKGTYPYTFPISVYFKHDGEVKTSGVVNLAPTTEPRYESEIISEMVFDQEDDTVYDNIEVKVESRVSDLNASETKDDILVQGGLDPGQLIQQSQVQETEVFQPNNEETFVDGFTASEPENQNQYLETNEVLIDNPDGTATDFAHITSLNEESGLISSSRGRINMGIVARSVLASSEQHLVVQYQPISGDSASLSIIDPVGDVIPSEGEKGETRYTLPGSQNDADENPYCNVDEREDDELSPGEQRQAGITCIFELSEEQIDTINENTEAHMRINREGRYSANFYCMSIISGAVVDEREPYCGFQQSHTDTSGLMIDGMTVERQYEDFLDRTENIANRGEKLDVYVGDSLEVQVDIRNFGTTSDTGTLELKSEGDQGISMNEEVEVEQGETETVTFNIPMNTELGELSPSEIEEFYTSPEPETDYSEYIQNIGIISEIQEDSAKVDIETLQEEPGVEPVELRPYSDPRQICLRREGETIVTTDVQYVESDRSPGDGWERVPDSEAEGNVSTVKVHLSGVPEGEIENIHGEHPEELLPDGVNWQLESVEYGERIGKQERYNLVYDEEQRVDLENVSELQHIDLEEQTETLGENWDLERGLREVHIGFQTDQFTGILTNNQNQERTLQGDKPLIEPSGAEWIRGPIVEEDELIGHETRLSSTNPGEIDSVTQPEEWEKRFVQEKSLILDPENPVSYRLTAEEWGDTGISWALPSPPPNWNYAGIVKPDSSVAQFESELGEYGTKHTLPNTIDEVEVGAWRKEIRTARTEWKKPVYGKLDRNSRDIREATFKYSPTSGSSDTWRGPVKAKDFEYESKTIELTGENLALSDRIEEWLWEFEDGQTIMGQDVEKTYDEPGTYNPILTVVGEDGSRQQYETEVRVLREDLVENCGDFTQPELEIIDYSETVDKNTERITIEGKITGDLNNEWRVSPSRSFGNQIGWKGSHIYEGEEYFTMFIDPEEERLREGLIDIPINLENVGGEGSPAVDQEVIQVEICSAEEGTIGNFCPEHDSVANGVININDACPYDPYRQNSPCEPETVSSTMNSELATESDLVNEIVWTESVDWWYLVDNHNNINADFVEKPDKIRIGYPANEPFKQISQQTPSPKLYLSFDRGYADRSWIKSTDIDKGYGKIMHIEGQTDTDLLVDNTVGTELFEEMNEDGGVFSSNSLDLLKEEVLMLKAQDSKVENTYTTIVEEDPINKDLFKGDSNTVSFWTKPTSEPITRTVRDVESNSVLLDRIRENNIEDIVINNLEHDEPVPSNTDEIIQSEEVIEEYQGDATVEGAVIARDTKYNIEPLENKAALVTLTSQRTGETVKRVFTDENGEYEIEGISRDQDYIITAEYVPSLLDQKLSDRGTIYNEFSQTGSSYKEEGVNPISLKYNKDEGNVIVEYIECDETTCNNQEEEIHSGNILDEWTNIVIEREKLSGDQMELNIHFDGEHKSNIVTDIPEENNNIDTVMMGSSIEHVDRVSETSDLRFIYEDLADLELSEVTVYEQTFTQSEIQNLAMRDHPGDYTYGGHIETKIKNHDDELAQTLEEEQEEEIDNIVREMQQEINESNIKLLIREEKIEIVDLENNENENNDSLLQTGLVIENHDLNTSETKDDILLEEEYTLYPDEELVVQEHVQSVIDATNESLNDTEITSIVQFSGIDYTDFVDDFEDLNKTNHVEKLDTEIEGYYDATKVDINITYEELNESTGYDVNVENETQMVGPPLTEEDFSNAVIEYVVNGDEIGTEIIKTEEEIEALEDQGMVPLNETALEGTIFETVTNLSEEIGDEQFNEGTVRSFMTELTIFELIGEVDVKMELTSEERDFPYQTLEANNLDMDEEGIVYESSSTAEPNITEYNEEIREIENRELEIETGEAINLEDSELEFAGEIPQDSKVNIKVHAYNNNGERVVSSEELTLTEINGRALQDIEFDTDQIVSSSVFSVEMTLQTKTPENGPVIDSIIILDNELSDGIPRDSYDQLAPESIANLEQRPVADITEEFGQVEQGEENREVTELSDDRRGLSPSGSFSVNGNIDRYIWTYEEETFNEVLEFRNSATVNIQCTIEDGEEVTTTESMPVNSGIQSIGNENRVEVIDDSNNIIGYVRIGMGYVTVIEEVENIIDCNPEFTDEEGNELITGLNDLDEDVEINTDDQLYEIEEGKSPDDVYLGVLDEEGAASYSTIKTNYDEGSAQVEYITDQWIGFDCAYQDEDITIEEAIEAHGNEDINLDTKECLE